MKQEFHNGFANPINGLKIQQPGNISNHILRMGKKVLTNGVKRPKFSRSTVKLLCFLVWPS